MLITMKAGGPYVPTVFVGMYALQRVTHGSMGDLGEVFMVRIDRWPGEGKPNFIMIGARKT